MATLRGRAEVSAHMKSLPAKLSGVLRGAARAGAGVIATEIKAQTPSQEVRENLRISSKAAEGKIRVTIDIKPGWARSVGTWLEFGTSPHFITVDDSQRQGMSVRKVNEREKEGRGSLIIGGNFVGETVFHPGARPHPAFRPALDAKEGEAIAAAQKYINSRIKGGRIEAGEGDDA